MTEKLSFSLTDAGHRLDAAMYGSQARAQAEQGQAQQAYGQENPLLSLLGGQHMDALQNLLNSRHNHYAAGEHEQGSNAWNPLGGLLTPTPYEQPKMAGAAAACDHYKLAALKPGLLATLGRGVRGAGQTLSANPQQALRLATMGGGAVLGATAGSQVDPQHAGMGAALGGLAGMTAGGFGGQALAGQRGVRDAVRGLGSGVTSFGKSMIRRA